MCFHTWCRKKSVTEGESQERRGTCKKQREEKDKLIKHQRGIKKNNNNHTQVRKLPRLSLRERKQSQNLMLTLQNEITTYVNLIQQPSAEGYLCKVKKK